MKVSFSHTRIFNIFRRGIIRHPHKSKLSIGSSFEDNTSYRERNPH